MVQSGVVLPEHLDIFDKGIARRLDYSYSGPYGGCDSGDYADYGDARSGQRGGAKVCRARTLDDSSDR